MGGKFVRVAGRCLALVGVTVGMGLLVPAPAAAHNSLTGSDPADGARLAEPPKRVQLRFLAKVAPDTTKITITGPDSVSALGGEPTFSGQRVNVPFQPGAAGRYVVSYQIGSADGHPVKGEIRFTLTVGASVEPTTPEPEATAAASGSPSAVVPSATVPSAGQPVTATPVPAADVRSEGGPPWWSWLLGGAAVLVALAGGLFFWRRQRQSQA